MTHRINILFILKLLIISLSFLAVYSLIIETTFAKTIKRGESVTVEWVISGTGGLGCNGSFVGVYPDNSPGETVLDTWNNYVTLTPTGDLFFPTVWGDPAAPFPQTYTFRCSVGATATTAPLTINDCDPSEVWNGTACVLVSGPTINSFTGPASVMNGAQPTLNWDVTNATDCSINPGAYITSPVLSGSHAMPAITTATTYTLSCMNGAGAPVTDTVSVDITAIPAPNINSFTGPASVMSGSQPTLNWDVANATGCTINPGAYTTSPILIGGHAMSAITTATTYTLSCMNGAVGPTEASVPVSVVYPNLEVTATSFPAGPLYLGTGVSVGGTIRNTGGANTLTSVYSNVTYQYGGTSGAWLPVTEFDNGMLNAGETASPDSTTFTPGSVGTLYLQYCADSRNQVYEDAGEAGNCVQSPAISVLIPIPETPTNLRVTANPTCGGRLNASWDAVAYAASYRVSIDGGAYQNVGNVTNHTFNGLIGGSTHTIRVIATNTSGDSTPATDSGNASATCDILTVTNCTIANYARTCLSKMTWDITGAAAPSIWNAQVGSLVPLPPPGGIGPGGGSILSTVGVPTGNNVDVTLMRGLPQINGSTGNNVFRARDGATAIRSRTAVASCLASSFFHTFSSVNRCEPKPVILITPDPVWIRSGERADLNFAITADFPGLACTFSGGMTGASPINHIAQAASENYPRTTDPLTSAQTVRIICTAPGLSPSVFEEVRVNVLPEIEEV